MSQETVGHRKLKAKVAAILEACGFDVDQEVKLNYSGDRNAQGQLQDDMSFDVVARVRRGPKTILLVVESKDKKSITGPKIYLDGWRDRLAALQKHHEEVVILDSDRGKVTPKDFTATTEIHVAHAFTELMDQAKFETFARFSEKRGFVAWDHKAVTYFDGLANTLESAARYEVLREFGVEPPGGSTLSFPAVEITQKGHAPMYLMGLPPGLLVRLGYVSRRAAGKIGSYQRILSKKRVDRIAIALKGKKAILPNAIILAFDDEAGTQSKVEFKNGEFHFADRYCSAWLIDGQHRVYAFARSTKGDWAHDKDNGFRLPVVAFKRLALEQQGRTFIDINYFQKKINASLLCDLATDTKDLRNGITWPSLLVKELERESVLQGMVKITEFDHGRPITLSSFVKYGLLESVLGYKESSGTYEGPLFTLHKFEPRKRFQSKDNQKAFKAHLALLRRYFGAVKKNTQKATVADDPWRNPKAHHLVSVTGINAQLLVLTRIMQAHPQLAMDLDAYLVPLSGMSFKKVARNELGGGWKGFRQLANRMIHALNQAHGNELRSYSGKKKL